MSSRIAPAMRSLRRAVTLHRRLLAAGCTAAAVAIGLGVVSPPPPPTRQVVVAATDLQGGQLLTRADLDLQPLPPVAIPAGVATRPERMVGRTLAAPMRQGEPLTDVRVLGPSLVRAYGPGLVAAPVRIADADSVALLRVGDSVDILAPDPSSQLPTSVAVADAPVVALPHPDEEVAASTAGALIVVAVSTDEALQLAQQSVLGPLVLTLRE